MRLNSFDTDQELSRKRSGARWAIARAGAD